MKKEELDKTIEAGKIAQKVVVYAREIIKPETKLIDIANKIDCKIEELGAKPAFPVNLSINEIAAHATPAFNDEKVARGLLKVDIGVQIDGYVADTAFSLDLENSEENKKLIEAAEAGLKASLETFKVGATLGEIGKNIQNAVEEKGFVTVKNLTGHKIEQYDLHAGVNIPNYASGQDFELDEGVYATEPFVTNGLGKVKDGKLSGIYSLSQEGNVRDNFAREVLNYIIEEYGTLPFCSRWIHKKFGSRGLLSLRQIEQTGILHQYAQLVEVGKGKVAQAEHTVLLTSKEKIVTTRD
jgi:methionyl aminopeptidase